MSFPNLSRLCVVPTGAYGAKRDRDDTTVTLTVSSTLLNPEELELTFDITANDDSLYGYDGSLFVELREPRDCKFSFSISADLTTAESGGYNCEQGRGARVLPRLIVGAMHALEKRGYAFPKLPWTGEAVCNFKDEWDHAEYTDAEDKDANIAEQAKKIGWRLDYYARLGFEVGGSVDDVADILRESLEECEDEEDEPNLDNQYIPYYGDIVQLSEAWKVRFELSIIQED